MVFAFTSGVMVIFLGFGLLIMYVNQNLLKSKNNIKVIFTSAGVVSLVVGSNILLT